MILEILTLLAAIPTGILISYYTQDELKQGKPWFRILIILSAIATIIFLFTNKTPEALTSAFILITTFFSQKT